jgi:hypothetical protein
MRNPAPDSLDAVLEAAFVSFADQLRDSAWYGKEREAISVFVMSHLVPRCRPGTVLHDAGQIGIEVRVPQLPGPGRKAAVCKDLVIWPKAGMTCWDQARRPTQASLAVLEWKCSKRSFSTYDLDWLVEFTRANPTCTGFVVCFNRPPASPVIRIARVVSGDVHLDWLTA